MNEHDFSADPHARLVRAHDELRAHLHALLRASRLMLLGRADVGNAPAIAKALRFFAVDVALHARDEEESLLPRLRAKLKDPQSHFAWLLEHIEQDHVELASVHRDFDAAARRLAARLLACDSPKRADLEPALSGYRELLGKLLAIYHSHMKVEERDIFPALAVVFTAQERAAMAAEMSERRALVPVS